MSTNTKRCGYRVQRHKLSSDAQRCSGLLYDDMITVMGCIISELNRQIADANMLLLMNSRGLNDRTTLVFRQRLSGIENRQSRLR